MKHTIIALIVRAELSQRKLEARTRRFRSAIMGKADLFLVAETRKMLMRQR